MMNTHEEEQNVDQVLLQRAGGGIRIRIERNLPPLPPLPSAQIDLTSTRFDHLTLSLLPQRFGEEETGSSSGTTTPRTSTTTNNFNRIQRALEIMDLALDIVES